MWRLSLDEGLRSTVGNYLFSFLFLPSDYLQTTMYLSIETEGRSL